MTILITNKYVTAVQNLLPELILFLCFDSFIPTKLSLLPVITILKVKCINGNKDCTDYPILRHSMPWHIDL